MKEKKYWSRLGGILLAIFTVYFIVTGLTYTCGTHEEIVIGIQNDEADVPVGEITMEGCSPDNSACEGFFGRLKNEMFYGRSWKDVSTDEFIKSLDTYIRWYNNDRIKKSLGWMSPLEYRMSLGLIDNVMEAL